MFYRNTSLQMHVFQSALSYLIRSDPKTSEANTSLDTYVSIFTILYLLV